MSLGARTFNAKRVVRILETVARQVDADNATIAMGIALDVRAPRVVCSQKYDIDNIKAKQGGTLWRLMIPGPGSDRMC